MKLLVKPSRISGTFAVPGSKSHTIRGTVAGLMANGVSVLRYPLLSADTLSTLAAIEELGAGVEQRPNEWRITGTGGKLRNPGHTIDLGNSGTGLRLLAAAACAADFPVTFDGDASLRTRVMKPLLASLEELGASTDATRGRCPLTVRGPLKGGHTVIEAVTSQFLSALLFAVPYAKGDSEIEVPLLNEKPYIGITLDWLRRLGINLADAPDWSSFQIAGRQCFDPIDRVIPADFSTVAFPLGAAALVGAGDVVLKNLDFTDSQGDKAIFDDFRELGCFFSGTAHDFIIHPDSRLHPAELDLNATPDALPLLAAVMAAIPGESRLINVPQARIKETDRIACMTRELRKMGADIEELEDGMVIRGGRLHGAELKSYDDHRIVMALAVAALAADSPSLIDHAEAARVTYPDFFTDFQRCGADFTLMETN